MASHDWGLTAVGLATFVGIGTLIGLAFKRPGSGAVVGLGLSAGVLFYGKVLKSRQPSPPTTQTAAALNAVGA